MYRMIEHVLSPRLSLYRQVPAVIQAPSHIDISILIVEDSAIDTYLELVITLLNIFLLIFPLLIDGIFEAK